MLLYSVSILLVGFIPVDFIPIERILGVEVIFVRINHHLKDILLPRGQFRTQVCISTISDDDRGANVDDRLKNSDRCVIPSILCGDSNDGTVLSDGDVCMKGNGYVDCDQLHNESVCRRDGRWCSVRVL